MEGHRKVNFRRLGNEAEVNSDAGKTAKMIVAYQVSVGNMPKGALGFE